MQALKRLEQARGLAHIKSNAVVLHSDLDQVIGCTPGKNLDLRGHSWLVENKIIFIIVHHEDVPTGWIHGPLSLFR